MERADPGSARVGKSPPPGCLAIGPAASPGHATPVVPVTLPAGRRYRCWAPLPGAGWRAGRGVSGRRGGVSGPLAGRGGTCCPGAAGAAGEGRRRRDPVRGWSRRRSRRGPGVGRRKGAGPRGGPNRSNQSRTSYATRARDTLGGAERGLTSRRVCLHTALVLVSTTTRFRLDLFGPALGMACPRQRASRGSVQAVHPHRSGGRWRSTARLGGNRVCVAAAAGTERRAIRRRVGDMAAHSGSLRRRPRYERGRASLLAVRGRITRRPGTTERKSTPSC